MERRGNTCADACEAEALELGEQKERDLGPPAAPQGYQWRGPSDTGPPARQQREDKPGKGGARETDKRGNPEPNKIR